MNDPLGYIIDKWDLKHITDPHMPIHIPNTTRVDLAKLFCELGYKKGVEVGTSRGSYAITMSMNNPGVHLYCVDAWKTYDGCHDFTDQNVLDRCYQVTKTRLARYKGIKIINKFSMDAVKDFADESLSFVYIDANHEFPYVAEDLFYWAKKVKPGGIVSGHDYLSSPGPHGCMQVREVVDAYTKAFKIKKWFVVDEWTLPKAGSWFWVKP
jgi:predicted O-methyltransferase YrrM